MDTSQLVTTWHNTPSKEKAITLLKESWGPQYQLSINLIRVNNWLWRAVFIPGHHPELIREIAGVAVSPERTSKQHSKDMNELMMLLESVKSLLNTKTLFRSPFTQLHKHCWIQLSFWSSRFFQSLSLTVATRKPFFCKIRRLTCQPSPNRELPFGRHFKQNSFKRWHFLWTICHSYLTLLYELQRIALMQCLKSFLNSCRLQPTYTMCTVSSQKNGKSWMVHSKQIKPLM